MNITKYNIAELTSRPYLKALSPDNLISTFLKTGIHPFNSHAITESQVAPSVIYSKETDVQDKNNQEVMQKKKLLNMTKQWLIINQILTKKKHI